MNFLHSVRPSFYLRFINGFSKTNNLLDKLEFTLSSASIDFKIFLIPLRNSTLDTELNVINGWITFSFSSANAGLNLDLGFAAYLRSTKETLMLVKLISIKPRATISS